MSQSLEQSGAPQGACGCHHCECGAPDTTYAPSPAVQTVKIPDYLEKTYWWAYVRPWAVKFWEREWLTNLILLGNYNLLRDETLAAYGDHVPGKTLQISCAYGSMTPHLYDKIAASGGELDVIDVVQPQLDNLNRKLPVAHKARLMRMDSTNLSLPDAAYDRVMLFFLPHEQPREFRLKSFNEAFRVVKPGGTVIIMEFARPKWWNPIRYFYFPFLAFLEPFAPDIWKHDDVTAWLPKTYADRIVSRKKFFGSVFQLLQIKA
jgi:ubiquinone/menaquinone biosynthesis C-methylase UbiE